MSALTYATAKLLRLLPREQISRACGKLADLSWHPSVGSAVVGVYGKLLDVDFEECEGAPSEAGWKSFDEFFTRPLRAGRRPIAGDSHTVVSPADGKVVAIDRIDRHANLVVKGRPYKVHELLADKQEAERYVGGTGCVVYLSPRDYHRVHSPAAGLVTRVNSIAGEYYPVNAVGERHIENLFAINRRVSISIDTPPESNLGRVTVVMVAAIVVGRVTVVGINEKDVPHGAHRIDPPLPLKRGDELGMFHLGSTAVVLLEGRASDKIHAQVGPIRYGEALTSSAASGKHGNGGGARA